MDENKKLEEIQQLVKDKKIVFAPQDKVQLLRPWLDKIKDALQIKSWFISDESTIGDFGVDDEELQRLRTELGIEVNEADYLVDVAERLSHL